MKKKSKKLKGEAKDVGSSDLSTDGHEYDDGDHDYGNSALLSSLQRFFNTSTLTDFTLRSGNKEFNVHKVVICGQSEYFSRMFEADWKETGDNAIDLQEDDTQAVEAMIHFMYGFDYDSNGGNDGGVSPMLFNIEVYKIADKYNVPPLKRRAKDKFKDAVCRCWEMDDFYPTIVEVYAIAIPSARELRDVVANVSREHINDLMQIENFLLVLYDCAGFAADLLKLQVSASKTEVYRCPSCCHEWRAELPSLTGECHCFICGSYYTNWEEYRVD